MLKEELAKIIKKEKDILPFLKKLTPEDKKGLVPELKKLKEEYYAQKEVRQRSNGYSYTSYEYKKSEKQRNLVEKACFVCCNKTDFKKLFWGAGNTAASDEYIEDIIPWYIPKWYSQVINEDMPWDMNYSKLMSLYKRSILEPSTELIINKLPGAITSWERVDNQQITRYRPETLLEHKETLDEHLWYLFETESGINHYYAYNRIENYNGGTDIWIHTLKELSEKNKINRKKLLIAGLHSSTKGFNKTLSGWYFDLILALNPSLEEVVALQNDFFVALNSPHSKVVNTGLKYFKLAATSKKFNRTAFLDSASILLSSETKSVVNSTLMILDKLGKTFKTGHNDLCEKASEALIQQDEKIQIRAAKLIVKYGKTTSQDLQESISQYSDYLYHTPKSLLNSFLLKDAEEEETAEEVQEKQLVLREENKLPTYTSFDELVFFVSQSIDNNEVYHIDQLVSFLPKLNILITAENVDKLEPLFKRTLDLALSFDGWNSQIGSLETEAACYINDYANILMKRYPRALQNFKSYKNKKVKQVRQNEYMRNHVNENLKKIEVQTIPDYIYQIHHTLFIKSKQFIEQNLDLEILSTPTHYPCWIDPEVLIERVLSYEKNGITMEFYDFQVAFGRLPQGEKSEVISTKIAAIQNTEIKEIFNYFYDFESMNAGKIGTPPLWLPSVLTKRKTFDLKTFKALIDNELVKETSSYEWNSLRENYRYERYDYVNSKKIYETDVRKKLILKGFGRTKEKEKSGLEQLKSIFKKKEKPFQSLYDLIRFNRQKYQTTIQPNDDIKFLYLSPNNPGVFLSQILNHNLKYSTFSSESEKKNMNNVLKALHEIWGQNKQDNTTYLFLATGFLCSEKVAREIACELWIKVNYESNLNNKLLGESLGKLEYNEYAPLKRFTDVVVENLFNISGMHNKALLILFEAMIQHMNPEPIRNTKKVLEIFSEMKHKFDNYPINELTRLKLLKWQETSSLKPIIKKLF